MIYASDLIAKFKISLKEKWGYIWGMTYEMWTAEKQEAYYEKYKDDPDRGKSAENGWKWIGHWVTDCSGLFTHWFKVLGGEMYHGSDTMFKKWCVKNGELVNGKRTDGEDLKPGTAVFCWNGKKYSHVGLYVGGGYVIEAAGSSQGVIQSKITNDKWKYWGELKGITMNVTEKPEAADPAPDPERQENRPTIRKGSRGEYVTLMQTMLVNRGYSLGNVDGIFGAKTDAAVREFQKANGLAVDGVCGPKTWAALDDIPEASGVTYTVTISGISKDQAMELLRMYPEADVKEERGENNA